MSLLPTASKKSWQVCFNHCTLLGLNFDCLDTIGYGVSKEDWRFEVEQISWTPRAFYIRNLLTDEECEHLIKLVGALDSCRLFLRDFNVLGYSNDGAIVSRWFKHWKVSSKWGSNKYRDFSWKRYSYLSLNLTSLILFPDQDEVVRSIEERISRVTMLPICKAWIQIYFAETMVCSTSRRAPDFEICRWTEIRTTSWFLPWQSQPRSLNGWTKSGDGAHVFVSAPSLTPLSS